MKSERGRMKSTVELVRRGGVILKEPCPTCGGIQVKYHGKNYCSNHDDLTAALAAQELNLDVVLSGLRGLVLAKVKDTSDALGQEKDFERQERLVSLLTKYVDLLQKLPEK
jgi:uncharacterized Zn finger protein (UPF0148 family)